MENYTQEEAISYVKERFKRTKDFDQDSKRPMRYGEHEFIMQFTDGGPGRDLKNLGGRLLQIQEIIHSYGAKVVFVSYPAHGGYYIHASLEMQKLHQKGEIELIDVSEHFSDCPKIERCPELLFFDGHPKAKGYRRTAQFIREQLPQYLP